PGTHENDRRESIAIELMCSAIPWGPGPRGFIWATTTAFYSDFMLTRLTHGRRMAHNAPQAWTTKIRGNAMHLVIIGILGVFLFAATFADAATITGTVSGPDGAPFRAAFVQARHAKLKMTVSVLSDNAGR